MFTFILLLTFLAPLLKAQELRIYNWCGTTLYAWEQGELIRPLYQIENNTSLRTNFSAVDPGDTKDIVVSHDSDGVNNGAPVLRFRYDFQDIPNVGYWLDYALKNDDGIPFRGHNVTVDGPHCGGGSWADGMVNETFRGACIKFEFLNMRLCEDTMVSNGSITEV